jgi:hypothetical protein
MSEVCEDSMLQIMYKRGARHTLDFLDFISIPKKMIVLNSSNRYGMVGVGLGELRKGGKLIKQRKRNAFSLSNYN